MIICKNCNKNTFAGQAFTKYTCKICDKEQMHHNTNIPKVCSECSEKFNVCKRCGRKIEEEE